MTEATSTVSPAQAARALIKSLQAQFEVFREHRPLAIGIDKQLFAKQPELPRKTLRMALSFHTNSLPYLKAVANGTDRYDLEGNKAEALTDEHRQHALAQLRERMKKQAEQHKAKRAAETAERERAEKLKQLTEKFGRR